MQTDYDDIRFKHEDYPLSWLEYWIESKNTTTVNVWVLIPNIPLGESTFYLFYGNPLATSQSDFNEVFTWQTEWTDERLFKRYLLTKEEIAFIESKIRPMALNNE